LTTTIGLLGDVHAQAAPVAEALSIFEREEVDHIICAGDIAGYFEQLKPVIELLKDHHCRTIIGNHDQAYLESHAEDKDTTEYRYLDDLPETLEYVIEGKRIHVVHAHPPASQHGGIKLLDVNGKIIPEQELYWQKQLHALDADVLIVGHTHQVFAQQIGDVMLINPGSSVFNHSCAILELPSMQVEFFSLEGKEILKSWNFSMLFRSDDDYPPAKA
jgi:putative phosphoesterase